MAIDEYRLYFALDQFCAALWVQIDYMSKKATGTEIRHLFGPITDQLVVDILKAGASYRELEDVALRLAQEDDELGSMRRPLTGGAAKVYDILISVEEFRDDWSDD